MFGQKMFGLFVHFSYYSTKMSHSFLFQIIIKERFLTMSTENDSNFSLHVSIWPNRELNSTMESTEMDTE